MAFLSSHLPILASSETQIVGTVHAGHVDGPILCRLFNGATSKQGWRKYLSSDNDPLFQYHHCKKHCRGLFQLPIPAWILNSPWTRTKAVTPTNLIAITGKTILRSAGVTNMAVRVTPLRYVSVVIESAITAFIMLTLFLMVSVFQVRVNFDALEMTVFKLATPVSRLAIPVYGPKYVVMMAAVEGESRHGNALKFPRLRHDCVFAPVLVLRIICRSCHWQKARCSDEECSQ